MTRALRRLVVVLTGTLGLAAVTVATAAPALAAGLNHTEPFTTADRAAARIFAPSGPGGNTANRGE